MQPCETTVYLINFRKLKMKQCFDMAHAPALDGN